jgi:3-mercaptopyruvate sulfurtransferase SseA
VANAREGKFVVYKLADHAVLDLLSALRKITEQNSAVVEQLVRSYFNNLDSLEPLTRKELMQRLRVGAVMVLDVRPKDEFGLGHLPGAVNIPLRERGR